MRKMLLSILVVLCFLAMIGQGSAQMFSRSYMAVPDGETSLSFAISVQVYHTLTIETMTCHGDYSGYSTISPAVGTYSYLGGTVVLVLAHPSEGFYFDCWHLDGVEIDTQSPEIYVTMDTDHVLLAIYNPFQYTPTPPTPPPVQPPPVIPSPVQEDFTLTIMKFASKPVAYFGLDFGRITPDVGVHTVPSGTIMSFIASDIKDSGFHFYAWFYGTDASFQESFNRTVEVTVTEDMFLYAFYIP